MELTSLPLDRFWWSDTDLCSPLDPAFQEWLKTIFDERSGPKCPP